MAIANPIAPAARSASAPFAVAMRFIGETPLAFLQLLIALTLTLPALRLLRPLICDAPPSSNKGSRPWVVRFVSSVAVLICGGLVSVFQLLATAVVTVLL